MSNSEVQVGTNYYGRMVTALEPFRLAPHIAFVHYTDEHGDGVAGLNESLSWLNVQRGGEPTDKWHAFCMRLRSKGLKSRKRIVIDGKVYRMRRGKLVEIPEQWVGKTTHPQRIRKRKSKKNQGRRYKRKVVR